VSGANTEIPADGSPEDVITNLRRRYDELTQSQKRIAELIVDDPEFVSFATVDKVAGRLSVSPSTIVRFAYRIGLAGYPDLQEQVRSKLLRVLRNGEASESHGTGSHLGHSLASSSLQHDVEILATTAQRTDTADIEAAIALLADARRVRVIGGMTAFSIAYYAAVTLDRVRDGVLLLRGEPLPTGPLLDLGEEDVVLAFSFPPYAKSTLDAVRATKARGASVVAVSDSPISPVRDSVDVLLPVVVSGIGAQNSLVAAMALANVIVNGVTLAVPAALERYAETVELLSGWDVYLLQPGQDD
jgi:DNA-binding MurR/RpiR family transcriptional regulator